MRADPAEPVDRVVARDDDGGGRPAPDDLHVDAGRRDRVTAPKRLPVRADVVVLKVTTLARCGVVRRRGRARARTGHERASRADSATFLADRRASAARFDDSSGGWHEGRCRDRKTSTCRRSRPASRVILPAQIFRAASARELREITRRRERRAAARSRVPPHRDAPAARADVGFVRRDACSVSARLDQPRRIARLRIHARAAERTIGTLSQFDLSLRALRAGGVLRSRSLRRAARACRES